MHKARSYFKDWIREREAIYSPSDMNSILNAFCTPRKTSLRINKLKVSEAERPSVIDTLKQNLANLKLKKAARLIPAPWGSGDVHYISNPSVMVRHLAMMKEHKAGLFHFQSLSSTIPALCLAAQKDDRVLDMCAAPVFTE
jgi:16S rRNA C967 or C1407 C5-methylase (RsmB/RsmF family)